MDCLDPWHPAHTCTFCKAHQVGGSEVLTNWIGYIADQCPAPTMVVRPTLTDAHSWVREKISPSIRATPAMARRFVEQRSREGSSTTLFKKFPRGFLVITGANTSVDISSKTVRFIGKDEWDRWPHDVDAQGDPDKLVNARQTSYTASGQAKTFQVSTPANLKDSRIWAAYMAGDRRKYFVPCPHCNFEQELNFKPKYPDGRGGLKFDLNDLSIPPFYVCENGGCVIEHWQKRDMLARGRWKSTLPDEECKGRQPSFHINALYSPVTTWLKMVEEFKDAKDNPQKLRTFVNLWLGEPWEEKGDAPDWQRLFAMRHDYARGVIPCGGLIVTAAADVQKDGVFYEVVAWGRDRKNWSIDAGFIEGDTANPDGQVWLDLAAVFDTEWPDTFGNRRKRDREAVDSGFNANAVYNFTRKRPHSYAVKGDDGWFLPALGTPTRQDVNLRGKRIRRGVKLWPVGTWPLKSEFYASLRLQGVREGLTFDPPGYCYFTEQLHDQGYFKQITAESLTDRDARGKLMLKNGRPVHRWMASGPNHYLDCRIYNMALSDHLGVSRMTPEQWDSLAAAREVAQPGAQSDLFTQPVVKLPTQQTPARPDPSAPHKPPANAVAPDEPAEDAIAAPQDDTESADTAAPSTAPTVRPAVPKTRESFAQRLARRNH